MKFNHPFRALFSGTPRALFNGSVRVLSNPHARRLARGNRPMLMLFGLGALAVGLALPLTGARHNSYQAQGAKTQTRTTTIAQAAPATTAPATAAPPASSATTGGGSSVSQSATAYGTGAASGSAGTAATATPVAAGSSSGGSSASQPQSPPQPATFNSPDHSSAQPAKVHLTAGVSDNGEFMFEEHVFQRLHVKTARLIVPWSVAVMRNKTQLRSTRKWLSSARSDHVQPMVSFAGNGNYIPSVPVYTAAIKAFLHDFPQVKVYTPWNEPDWIYRPALANNPGLAAAYFNTLAFWCHHCTIVAGDVYRPSWQGLASWVRSYSRSLHARPKAWAIHPYDDVREHSTRQIQALQSVTSGAIWLTEISGVERRGHCSCPNLSPNRANQDERYLFSLPKRFHRIQRIYHYQWQAAPWAHWDSGLVGPQGKPRPAYWTFANASKGKLP